MATDLSFEQLEAIRRLGTCAVADAIESFQVRLANEGYVRGEIRGFYESLGPMIGYAVTGRVRSADPPVGNSGFVEHMEWWRYVQSVPAPRVVVLQDLDRHPGSGSFWDELQVRIHLALGCTGTVTNGAVRHIEKVAGTGFHYFAGTTSVSRAFIHLIDFALPVEIGGLTIEPGDLIHADRDGILSVPKGVAADIPAAAQRLQDIEGQLIDLCRSAEFTVEEIHERAGELKYNIAGPGLHHRRGGPFGSTY